MPLHHKNLDWPSSPWSDIGTSQLPAPLSSGTTYGRGSGQSSAGQTPCRVGVSSRRLAVPNSHQADRYDERDIVGPGVRDPVGWVSGGIAVTPVPPLVRDFRVSKPVETQPKVEQQPPSLASLGFGSLIVETRSDAALRLEPGAILPFVGGLSSTDNRDIITMGEDGVTFTVTREGMYRLVLDTTVSDGAPGTLRASTECLSEECNSLSRLRVPRDGPLHASTILALKAGSHLSILCEGERPLTLAPSTRLQLYRVG